MHYVVAIVWVMVAIGIGYWAGRYGAGFPTAAVGADALPAMSRPAGPEERRAIEAMIRRYFATWSARDIDGYGACFMPDATILFVDPATGEGVPMELGPFLESQRQAHARAVEPMEEVAETIALEAHGVLAHVQVRWLLRKSGTETRGWDYFSLVKVNGEWKISHLSFYNDK